MVFPSVISHKSFVVLATALLAVMAVSLIFFGGQALEAQENDPPAAADSVSFNSPGPWALPQTATQFGTNGDATLTDADIDLPFGYGKFGWSFANVPEGTQYRVLRRVPHVENDTRPFRVLRSATTDTSITDMDVAVGHTYSYQVILLENGIETTRTVQAGGTINSRTKLYGYGVESGVRLHFSTVGAPFTVDQLKISRLDPEADSPALTVLDTVDAADYDGGYTDTTAVLGQYYQYQVEYLGPANEHGDRVILNTSQVRTFKAGGQDPSEPLKLTAIPSDSDNSIDLEWRVPATNPKSVALYEVLRRKVYATAGTAFEVIGTTTGTNLIEWTPVQATAYSYAVRPVSMVRERGPLSGVVDTGVAFEPLTCEGFGGIRTIDGADWWLVKPVITSLPGYYAYEAELFFILTPDESADEGFDVCTGGLDAEDFVVKQRTTFMHGIDASCPDHEIPHIEPSPLSCTLIGGDLSFDEKPTGLGDRPGLEPEVQPEQVTLHVSDGVLQRLYFSGSRYESAGTYRYQYQFCYTGSLDVCSEWMSPTTVFEGLLRFAFYEDDIPEPSTPEWRTSPPIRPVASDD